MMENDKSIKEVAKRIITDSANKFIPFEGKTWLLQPCAVSTMRYDYDVTQTRIFVSIIESLQSVISGVIKGNDASNELCLFSDNDFYEDDVKNDEILIPLRIQDFGIDCRRYADLKNELRKLASLTIEIHTIDKKGKGWIKFEQLCTPFISDQQYAKEVRVKMKKSVAELLVDVSLGYHRFLKEVVQNTRNKYFQRIYLFIRSYININPNPEITVKDFKDMLNIGKKYPRWNVFYAWVIAPALKEMKEKAEMNMIDCYFEVEKKYINNKKAGEPHSLIFHIYRSEFGKKMLSMDTQNSIIRDFIKEIRNEFDIKQSLISLKNIIKVDFIDDIRNKIPEWKSAMEKFPAKNRSAYLTTCISNYQNELEKAAYDKKIQENIAPVITEEASVSILTKQDAELADLFMRKLEEESDITSWKTYLKYIKIHTVKREEGKISQIIISAPSSFVVNIIEEKYLGVLVKILQSVFGDFAKLNYKIVN